VDVDAGEGHVEGVRVTVETEVIVTVAAVGHVVGLLKGDVEVEVLLLEFPIADDADDVDEVEFEAREAILDVVEFSSCRQRSGDQANVAVGASCTRSSTEKRKNEAVMMKNGALLIRL
jgi:hypothetical protein